MQREVFATVALAIGLVGLTAAGFIISHGYPEVGVMVAGVDLVIVLILLAYGSLMTHR